MTSKKSFSNPFWRSYRQGLKEGLLFPILLFFLFIANNVIKMVSFSKNEPRSEPPGEVTQRFLYLVAPKEGSGILPNMMFYIVVAVFAVLTAVSLFRFVAGKKAVNAYFSLGISRKSLFASRYLAGATLLAGALLVSMSVNLGWNLITFGSSPQLWAAWIYFTIGYGAVTLLAFGVGAAVMSSVGTLAEGIVLSPLVLGGPCALVALVQTLSSVFLFGSRGIQSYYSDVLSGQIRLESAWYQWASYDPMLFLYHPSEKWGSMEIIKGTANPAVGSALSWVTLGVWAVAALLVFFCGLFLFQRRRAEKAGFFGASQRLNTYILGIFGLGGFTLTAYAVRKSGGQSLWVAALCGLAVYSVVYLAVNALLLRDKQRFVKDLLKLPVHLGVMAAITVVLCTGLFGRFNQAPAIDQIEEAYISAPLGDNLLQTYGQGSMSMGTIKFLQDSLIGGLTEEKDLQAVRGIQETLSRLQGKAARSYKQRKATAGKAVILYRLKSGKEVFRYYDYMDVPAADQWISVLDTQWVRESSAKMLRGTMKTSDEALSYRAFRTSGQAYLYTGQGTQLEIPFEKNQLEELWEALAKDVEVRTARQTLFPEQVYGKVVFPVGSSEMIPTDRMEFDDMTESASAPEKSDYAANTTSVQIPITGTMKNTLAFLKENKMFDPLQSSIKVKSAAIARVKQVSGCPGNETLLWIQQNGVFLTANQDIDQGRMQKLQKYDITDPELLAQLQKLGKSCWYTYGQGYYIEYELENGRLYSAFLPEDQAGS